MHAAAATPAPTPTPAPTRAAAAQTPAIARMLGLLHWIIDYGMHLVDTIEQRAATDPGFPLFANISFRTANLDLIISRLLRGLRLAEALFKLLERRAARGRDIVIPADRQPSRRKPREPGAPPPARRKRILLSDDPTDAEIAAWLRRRPLGAALGAICRDFGVLPGYLTRPQWEELSYALTLYGGSFACFFRDEDLLRRARERIAHPGSADPDSGPLTEEAAASVVQRLLALLPPIAAGPAPAPSAQAGFAPASPPPAGFAPVPPPPTEFASAPPRAVARGTGPP